MTMLLIAGIAVLAAGLLAVAFGIPVKEFSFGNTLILAGAVAACTGVIMLGLAVVVRELRNIARRLGPANPAGAARAPELAVASAGEQPTSATLDRAEPAAQPSPSASYSVPWQEEVAARDRVRGRGDVAPEAAPPEPATATKPRRNLLFSSSSRRERERAARTPDPAAADPGPAPPVAPPAPKEAAPATFEDAWPQSDRARSDALRRTRTPSTFAEPNAAAPAPERPAPTVRSEEPAPVTVLKSGVVDGMAYSLYSDGSIEAQMPEGMMRFASIDELRSHLDQRP
ncbi:MAG: hypothetical protein QOJ84_2622 [Bradyrhizobium sp.]|nr:hypothetical protein [Bradyrhizobium sp.]